MAAEMSAPLFAEWIEFERLEPSGEQRADLRAASICRTIAEVNRDATRRFAPYRNEEFTLDIDTPVRQRSARRVLFAEVADMVTALKEAEAS